MKKIPFLKVAALSVGVILTLPSYANIIRVYNNTLTVVYADIPTCDGAKDTKDVYFNQAPAEWSRDCDVKHAWIGWRGDMGAGIAPCVDFVISKDKNVSTYSIDYGPTPFRLYCNSK